MKLTCLLCLLNTWMECYVNMWVIKQNLHCRTNPLSYYFSQLKPCVHWILGKNSNENCIKTYTFSFLSTHLTLSPEKWKQFRLGLKHLISVLSNRILVTGSTGYEVYKNGSYITGAWNLQVTTLVRLYEFELNYFPSAFENHYELSTMAVVRNLCDMVSQERWVTFIIAV